MANQPTTWLDQLLSVGIRNNGVDVPKRAFLNFTGGTLTDDPNNNATNVPLGGGGGGGDNVFTLTAATGFLRGQAFRVVSGQASLATTSLGQHEFAGIATMAVSGGSPGTFQVEGPVDPAIVTLGAGVVCAVGVDTSGNLKRATDATCASAPNWVGTCDALGNVFLAPRRNDARNMIDFGGLVADSSPSARAQNTAAIIAMMHSFPSAGAPDSSFGGEIFIPAGDWYLAIDGRDTINPTCIHVTHPVLLRGEGSPKLCPTTRLFFPPNSRGIKVWHGDMGINRYQNPNPDSNLACTNPDGTNSTATGARIEDLYLQAESLDSTVTTTSHAIECRTQTRISNVLCINWGGNGIEVSSTGGGFPDNCYIEWCRATNCLNGIHFKGGDSSACNGLGIDMQGNRGWGIFDESFLGNTFIGVHTEQNMVGPYNLQVLDGSSNLIGCYAELDQLTSELGQHAFISGGQQAADFSPGSAYFGGLAENNMHGARFTSGSGIPDFKAVGNLPGPTGTGPRLALSGAPDLLSITQIQLRVEITTAGYPGGYDSFHVFHPSQILVARYSLDGGSTWTSGVTPLRADAATTSKTTLGSSGLSIGWTPYLYALTDVYTTTGTGGLQTQLLAGSTDGTMTAWGWCHSDVARLDFPTICDYDVWRMQYNQTTLRWEQRWGNHISREYTGGRSLPYPGHDLATHGTWSGNAANGYRRITYYDAAQTIGTTPWRASTEQNVEWYSVGDLLFNRSQVTTLPMGLKVTAQGGYANRTAWSTSLGVFPGDTVHPITPNGRLFRADTAGTTSNSTEPNWASIPNTGDTIADNNVTWRNVGIEGSVFEPFGCESELPGTKDVSAGGAITLTELEAGHRIITLAGTPSDAFSVVVPGGPASGWARTINNFSTKAAVIKGSGGDTGIKLAAGASRFFASDGTTVTAVGKEPITGSPVADSSASSVADLRSNFNALLALLRANKVLDPFAPPATTTVLLDAGSLSASPVTTWLDLSGAGNNFTASGSPTWSSNSGPANTPAVTSNGSAMLAAATAAGMPATGWTMFAVMKIANTSYQWMVGPGNSTTGVHLLRGAGNQREIIAEGVDEMIDGAYTTNTWELWTAWNNGTTTFLAVNGVTVSVTNSTITPIAPAGPFSLFSRDGSTAAGQGAIAYVLACTSDIGSTERTRVNNYLLDKFAL